MAEALKEISIQMARLLLDTDILIDHLRGRKQAKEYLRKRWAGGDELYCSVISRAELFSGMRSREEASIRALLGLLHEIPVEAGVAEEAGRYRQKFGKSHGLLLPDALIAASAKSISATLVTLNTKHFPMRDITVVAPYKI